MTAGAHHGSQLLVTTQVGVDRSTSLRWMRLLGTLQYRLSSSHWFGFREVLINAADPWRGTKQFNTGPVDAVYQASAPTRIL